MPVKDYNADPDLNTQISGINIAEGCAPSGINNAIRQLMADVKEEFESEEEAVSSLDSALRSLIAEEVGDAESTASQQVSALDSTLRAFIAEKISLSVPAGTVIAFAANRDPEGFLLCNGASVSRTTYADLFAAIGTTYGAGNGSTTFRLPNMDGRVLQGSNSKVQYLDAGLPEIGGSTGVITYFDYKSSGAFYDTGRTMNSSFNKNTIFGGMLLHFSASRYNSIYGKSNTVQPKALTMRYYIKY